MCLLIELRTGYKPARAWEWLNEKEKSKIQLNSDFTFKSTNLPLDVINKQCLMFDKQQVKEWQGTWSLENKQLKLTMNNNSFYFLNVDKPFIFLGKHYLYLILDDEAGGGVISFHKQ